jgi:quinol monooxygenase YgiN
MITVLIHHKVSDFTKFKPVFDSAFQFRHNNGEESYKMFRNIHDPNDVTLMLNFPSADAAQKFVASDTLRARMKEAGVIGEPNIQVLAEAYLARRTSAD